MKPNELAVIVFLFSAICSAAVPLQTIFSLGKLNINPDTVTVSGFSAGSSMATQFHVAHSAKISGAALFSQAYYRCGPTSLMTFAVRCSKMAYDFFPYNVWNAIADAKRYSNEGLIDNFTNLKSNRVFIWTGEKDEYLSPATVVKNKDFYKAFIQNPGINIKVTVANGTKHLFPTDTYGGPCDQDAEQNLYLGNCNYSGAEHALRFLLGDIKGVPLDQKENGSKIFDERQLMLFDQSEFYRGKGSISKIGMGTLGHIYVPRTCASNSTQCHLHFHFHGCNEWPLDLARPYVLNNGFLPIAELNNIIVAFPLTTSIETNYNGCWDFFSYTNSKFATKEGEQIKVIYAMLQRLLNGL